MKIVYSMNEYQKQVQKACVLYNQIWRNLLTDQHYAKEEW